MHAKDKLGTLLAHAPASFWPPAFWKKEGSEEKAPLNYCDPLSTDRRKRFAHSASGLRDAGGTFCAFSLPFCAASLRWYNAREWAEPRRQRRKDPAKKSPVL